MERFTRPKFENPGYTPSLVDIDKIPKLSNDALFRGDVLEFASRYEEFHSWLRNDSWPIYSLQQLEDLCIKLDFRGTRLTPVTNSMYIWVHENAHKDVSDALKIQSDIRIARLAEPQHSRYMAYLDISIVDLLYVSENKVEKILANLGNILMGPALKDLGYKSETDRAKRMLDLSKRIRG